MYSDLSEIKNLLHHLGVSFSDLEKLVQLPYGDATQYLIALKERAHKNWKRLAFELHPDRTKNDPQKTELFQRLLQAKTKFEQLSVPHQPPPPSPRVVTPPTAHPTPTTLGVVFRAPAPSRRPPQVRNVGYRTATMKP